MEPKLIRTKEEYEKAIAWVDNQFDKAVSPNSLVGEKVQAMLLLIKQYEDEHYPVLPFAPLKAIRVKTEECGLKN